MYSTQRGMLWYVTVFVISLIVFAGIGVSVADAREARTPREPRASRIDILDRDTFAAELRTSIYGQACDTFEKTFSHPLLASHIPAFCEAHEPELPTLSLDADEEVIAEGESSILSWNSTNADSCEASGGWNGPRALFGTEEVTPTATTEYALTCENEDGTATESVTVTVATPPEAPTVSLDADPAEIEVGATSTLAWNTTNANSCEASGGWGGSKTLSGDEEVAPGTTTSYVLVCEGVGGSNGATTTVTVIEAGLELNHLLISEVYYDVDDLHGASEPGFEWVELYNPTSEDVDLMGWSIGDAALSDALPDGTIIEAHSFLILAATTTLSDFWDIPTTTPVVNLGGAIGNGLGNAGDALALTDGALTIVDALSWGSDISVFDPAAVDVSEGSSLARSALDVDTDTAIDWVERDIPTPGS